MRFLLKIWLILFFSFVLVIPAQAANEYIGTCPDEEIQLINEKTPIKDGADIWYHNQPEFTQAVPDVYTFYDPYLNNKYPKNTHLDTSMAPNPERVACLIEYAKKKWNSECGTKFTKQYIPEAIDSITASNWNPSVWLAIWIEETHAGDNASDPSYCVTGLREFGCGMPGGIDYGFENQLKCIDHGIKDTYKQNTFACWLCSYGGDCPDSLGCGYGDPDGVITHPNFKSVALFYDYLTRGVTSSLGQPQVESAGSHPLRPDPGKPMSVRDDQTYLTTYCAMRPTPVEMHAIDLRGKINQKTGKRDPVVDLKTVGLLTQDFREFITPLLSITDSTKADYSLPFNEKAQRYLADFLDGRAYYEPEPETEASELELQQQSDLFNRLGVFRKLAPQSLQDQYKKAIIDRAVGIFSEANNPYGFSPASDIIHNYIVGYWNAGQKKVVAKGEGQAITLADFYKNQAWAPLENDWQIYWSSAASLSEAHSQWAAKDEGTWFKLWPYVPLFSREDTLGQIEIIDSNPPPEPYSPSGKAEEQNESNPSNPTTCPNLPGEKGTCVDVSHPHLARAYEVSTALSYFLTPNQNHDVERPQLKDEWLPKMWENSSYWLDPSYPKPHPPKVPQEDVILGPLCDLDPNSGMPIYSSGDSAMDDFITTKVNRQDLDVPLEFLNLTPSLPINPTYDCADGSTVQYDCEKCAKGTKDESACFVYKQVRSNPNYLITYTPFLSQILTNTTLSGRGIFDILRVYDPIADEEKSLDQTHGWPGLGSEGQKSPKYDFKGGGQSRAEAGVYKAGDSQSYYYRFLGTVQCAKERAMQVLQPFLSGETYKPFAYACFPELEAPIASGSGTIGQATLSCADTDNVFLWQSDPRWKDTLSPNHPEYTNCTIGLCGCTSATTTIILNSFGSNTNIKDVWNTQHTLNPGGYQYNPGTEFEYCYGDHVNGPMKMFEERGLSAPHISGQPGPDDWNEVEKYLKECGLIYAAGDANWPNLTKTTRHTLVIIGIIKDNQGKVTAIKTIDPGTASGNNLVRTLGIGSSEWGYSIDNLWAITSKK